MIGIYYYSAAFSHTEPCMKNCFLKNDVIVRGIEKHRPNRNLLKFYMTLLSADITEDMLLSSPDGRYDEIEDMLKKTSLARYPKTGTRLYLRASTNWRKIFFRECRKILPGAAASSVS